MSFSYTLFLALLLLAPGFSVWAGLRLGERSDLISQAPERPGSTFSLLAIVFGALAGHIALSALLAVQESLCRAAACLAVGFDPNVYRVILNNGDAGARPLPAWAVLYWFCSLLAPALLTFALAWWASRWRRVQTLRERSSLGWLQPWVEQARPANSAIIAYVVTTMQHEGAYVAYEGLLVNLALDDNRAIAMIVLRNCDRFLVRITQDGAKRVEAPTSIGLIQLEAKNFLNIALEMFEEVPAG